jgi:hypothetical protein
MQVHCQVTIAYIGFLLFSLILLIFWLHLCLFEFLTNLIIIYDFVSLLLNVLYNTVLKIYFTVVVELMNHELVGFHQ